MDTQQAIHLHVEFLADGRVRIGKTVLSAEDSRDFLDQVSVSFDGQDAPDSDRLRRLQGHTGDLNGSIVLLPLAPSPTNAVTADERPIERLIEQYIEPDPNGRRPEEARLRDYGYAVWALLGDLLPPGRTAERVAREYRVPVEAVEAVWAYYLRHRQALDQRLAENRAA